MDKEGKQGGGGGGVIGGGGGGGSGDGSGGGGVGVGGGGGGGGGGGIGNAVDNVAIGHGSGILGGACGEEGRCGGIIVVVAIGERLILKHPMQQGLLPGLGHSVSQLLHVPLDVRIW